MKNKNVRLKELNQEAWELRKKQVREKTEEADTKLLLPLMLMFPIRLRGLNVTIRASFLLQH